MANPFVLDFSGPQNALAQWQDQRNRDRALTEQQRQFNATNALAEGRFGIEKAQFDEQQRRAAAFDQATAPGAPLPAWARGMPAGFTDAVRLAGPSAMPSVLSSVVGQPLQRAQLAHAVGSESRAAAMHPYQIEAQKRAADASKYIQVDDGKALFDATKREVVPMPGGGQTLIPKGKDRANIEEGMRKEISAHTKPYFETRDAWTRIQSSANDPSAAGDIALIFNFMKMLDPGSVVREGEFATAQNAGGVDQRVQAMYNRVIKGERLTPDIRADFLKTAGQLNGAIEKQYMDTQKQYHDIATRSGVDPRNVIIQYQPQKRYKFNPATGQLE